MAGRNLLILGSLSAGFENLGSVEITPLASTAAGAMINERHVVRVLQHSTAEFPMRTITKRLSGEANVSSLCEKLIIASQYFCVLPLPGDNWEIEVKRENAEILNAWIAQIEMQQQSKP